MGAPVILLASSSPRRREILQAAGFSCQVIASPEVVERGEGAPATVARWNARAKCRAASPPENVEGVVLGADTVVEVGGQTLGKPSDRQEARTMLQLLSGKWHRVVTGICLRTADGREVLGTTSTRVHVLPLADSWIRDYLSTGEADDKAGAYGIQGQMAQHVDRISGCYFNVVGLSPASVRLGLERLGEPAGDYLSWPGDS